MNEVWNIKLKVSKGKIMSIFNNKERYRFSRGDNHGRYGIGRKGSSTRRSGTGPRKWDPKVRKFRGAPRKYYRSCRGDGTRRMRGIKRTIRRVNNLTRGDKSKNWGRCGNSRSRWNGGRRVVAGRVTNGNN